MSVSYNSDTQYTRALDSFRGADMTSPDTEVATYRFAYIRNMYRDYYSGAGTAIETVPGYRQLLPPPAVGAEVYGIWEYTTAIVPMVLVHRGTQLIIFMHRYRDEISDLSKGLTVTLDGLAAHRSVAFVMNGDLYILDGTHYFKLQGFELVDMLENAYLPTTYVNGEMYEQRNMLTDKAINRDTQPQEVTYGAYQKIEIATNGNKTWKELRENYSGDIVLPGLASTNSEDQYYNILGGNYDGSTDLKRIALADSARYVNQFSATFKKCTSLESIYSEISIQGTAFAGCTALKEIRLRGSHGIIANASPFPAEVVPETIYLGKCMPVFVSGSGDDRVYSPIFLGLMGKSSTMYSGWAASLLTDAVDWELLARAYGVGHAKLNGISISGGVTYPNGSITVETAPPGGYLYDDTEVSYSLDDGSDDNGDYYTVRFDGVEYPLYYAEDERLTTSELPQPANVYVNGQLLYDTFSDDSSGREPVMIQVAKIGNAYYEVEQTTGVPDTYIDIISDTETESIFDTDPDSDTANEDRTFREIVCYDPAESVASVKIDGEDPKWWGVIYHTIDGTRYVDRVIISDNPNYFGKEVEVTLNCYPSEFKTPDGFQPLYSSTPDYKGTAAEAICGCQLAAQFDGRVFLGGNPRLPNTVFWCSRNLSAVADPSYFGQLNYVNDGSGANPIVALLPTASMLMVLKGDDPDEPTIYYHTGTDTGNDVIPRIYPSEAGVSGLGCVGAAQSFYDDAVFLSARGLEAVGRQQVNLERTLTHRSTYIDGVLTREELSDAIMTQWCGYLTIFTPSGNVYLADSRQISQDATGAAVYEFYRLEGVGHYSGQARDMQTTTGDIAMKAGTDGDTVWLSSTEDAYVLYDGGRIPLRLGEEVQYYPAAACYSSYIYPATTGNTPYRYSEGGSTISAYFTVIDNVAYLVEPSERYSGGSLCPATAAASIEGVLYFGTSDGALMAFNDDKRGKSYNDDDPGEGRIHSHWYTFDGRTISSAAVTAYDTAGYPGIAKKTVKKSLVVYAKSMDNSRMTVRVRTNRLNDWKTVGDMSAATYRPGATDYANAALQLSGEHIGTVKEKEKKWAVKQLLFDSGERHMCPIGFYSLSYRFTLKGRIKA